MDTDRSAMHTRPSLLVRVRDAADGDAWKLFSNTYRPIVYQFVRKKGLQAADADDLTQQVMEQVARSIRTFQYDPERGRFRDWLYRITRRQLSRFFKGRAAGRGGRSSRAVGCRRRPSGHRVDRTLQRSGFGGGA